MEIFVPLLNSTHHEVSKAIHLILDEMGGRQLIIEKNENKDKKMKKSITSN